MKRPSLLPQPGRSFRLIGVSMHAREVALVLLVSALEVCLVISGCGGAQTTRSIDSLDAPQYRWYADNVKTKVWVVGKVQNSGEAIVTGVEVHATLHNAQGSLRGKNMVLLKDLQPGENRTFNLGITRRGGTATVTLELKQPEEPD